MAELRRELTIDVRDVSRSAREMTNPLYYVRRFPWATAASAAAIGYMLVPKKKHRSSIPIRRCWPSWCESIRCNLDTSKAATDSQGMLKSLVVMGLTWALRTGLTYVGQQLTAAADEQKPQDANRDTAGAIAGGRTLEHDTVMLCEAVPSIDWKQSGHSATAHADQRRRTEFVEQPAKSWEVKPGTIHWRPSTARPGRGRGGRLGPGLDGETKMSTNGRARNNEPNVAASFSELTHDVIELAELQAQLFALDVKNTSREDADIAHLERRRHVRAAGLDPRGAVHAGRALDRTIRLVARGRLRHGDAGRRAVERGHPGRRRGCGFERASSRCIDRARN